MCARYGLRGRSRTRHARRLIGHEGFFMGRSEFFLGLFAVFPLPFPFWKLQILHLRWHRDGSVLIHRLHRGEFRFALCVGLCRACFLLTTAVMDPMIAIYDTFCTVHRYISGAEDRNVGKVGHGPTLIFRTLCTCLVYTIK